MWQWLKNLLGYDDVQDLDWINDLSDAELVEIFSRHVAQVGALVDRPDGSRRTLREAVGLWLRRKMTENPNYDWKKDPGEPIPDPPFNNPFSTEVKDWGGHP